MIRTAAAGLVWLLAACGGAECPEARDCPACPEGEVVSTPGGEVVATPVVETPSGDAAALVMDGIPDVPPALHDRMQRWLETRSAFLESISDDGTSVLV